MAIARLDQQIVDARRRDAACLASKRVRGASPAYFYKRLAKLEGYNNLLTTLRTNGATLEVVDSAMPALQSAQAKLVGQLPQRATRAFAPAAAAHG